MHHPEGSPGCSLEKTRQTIGWFPLSGSGEPKRPPLTRYWASAVLGLCNLVRSSFFSGPPGVGVDDDFQSRREATPGLIPHCCNAICCSAIFLRLHCGSSTTQAMRQIVLTVSWHAVTDLIMFGIGSATGLLLLCLIILGIDGGDFRR